MGVAPFYKWFEHDGVRGPNIATVYSDRGQGRAGAGGDLQPANEAGALLKPGDFDWEKSSPAGVQVVPFRRHFRGTVDHHVGAHPRGHGGRPKAKGAVGRVRPELPSETVGRGRRAGRAWSRSARSDRQQRGRPDRQRGGPAKGTRHRGAGSDRDESKLDPDGVLRDDRPRGREAPERQAASQRRCAKCIPPTGTTGQRCCGSRASSTSARRCQLDVVDRIGGGDGFAPAWSTAC